MKHNAHYITFILHRIRCREVKCEVTKILPVGGGGNA